MSKLAFKNPKQAAPTKPQILLYGTGGAGKTWFATAFPSVAYIDIEGGAKLPRYTERIVAGGGQYLGPEDGAGDPKFLIEQVRALATENHPFKTLVFDSVSKLWNQMISGEIERMELKGRSLDNTYGAEKKPAINFFRRLVSWLPRLDMNVVFIAHEKAVWVDNSQGVPTFDCWDKLNHELDLSLHAQKPPTKKNQTEVERIVTVRKSRLAYFPELDTFSLDFNQFKSRYENEYGKGILDADVKRITLASPDQIRELKSLISELKIAPEDVQKSLEKRGVVEFDDLCSSDADTMIKNLQLKLSASKS